MTSTMGASEASTQRAGEISGSELPDLVARCLAGDEDAWTVLVGRYERLVFSVAIRQGLSVEDAADVTQIVFQALFQSLGGIQSSPSLAAWLVSVTQRHCWRVNRRRHLEMPTDPAMEPLMDSGATLLHRPSDIDPDDTLDSLVIVEAVNSLPEPCRTLLLALYFDPAEPSYSEIAVRLRRPVGSIGPTRARCLETLRRALVAEGVL